MCKIKKRLLRWCWGSDDSNILASEKIRSKLNKSLKVIAEMPRYHDQTAYDVNYFEFMYKTELLPHLPNNQKYFEEKIFHAFLSMLYFDI